VIGRLGQALLALLRDRVPSALTAGSRDDRAEEPTERLEAARQRLKETIPPPQEH
jgi:hypothetical protein